VFHFDQEPKEELSMFRNMALAIAMLYSSVALAGETAGDVVSAQIRSQGYVCNKPGTARQLPLDSRPEETA
jgi:hypothetical protein